MRSRQELLFQGPSMYNVVESRGKQLDDAIAAYDGNRLLNTSTNDLAEYFEKTYRLEVPSIKVEEASVDQREAMVEVFDHYASFRGYGGRETTSVPGVLVTFVLPFDGDPHFFGFQPTTFNSMPPRAEVRGQELIVEISGRDLQPANVKHEIDNFVAGVKQYLDWFRPNGDAFNSSLVKRAVSVIDQRKSKLLSAQSLVAGLGFALKERPGSTKTYAAPQVRRSSPKPPPASAAPYKPEPVLAETEYQHILKVCQNMSVVLERSPSAFKGMDEESLRQHFLVQLNGHYEGDASGETFNMEGKTDILVRVDGKNIFIGECKFWKGEKVYLETIDQILGYLCWRDTKAAILLFNRNKNFSTVLDSIKASTIKHPSFKSGPQVEGEAKSRYVFRSKVDPNREIILSVLAFDVPTTDK